MSAEAGRAIECEALTVRRGDREVLTDASLSIRSGSVVAITGPSGSGKSTLLAAIAGLVQPESGSIRVDSESMWPSDRRHRARLRRERLGLVMQFGELFPELTVRENVRMPLLLQRRSDDERVDGLLDKLGLSGHSDDQPGRLSGGERQRAAIARALVARPAVVLADEPTGSLDHDMTRDTFNLFLSALRETEATSIVCTHDRWVAASCDEAYEIVSGGIERRP